VALRLDLIALLTSYSPLEPDEQQARIEMLDLAAVSLDPFDRTAYEPGHFTASGFVLHPDGARVLLIHHAKIGAWLQPGGHVDPHDLSPLMAARREVEEETGLTDIVPVTERIVDLDIHPFPERGDQPAHRHYDVRFAFVAPSRTLTPNHEVHDAMWATYADVLRLNPDRSMLRPIGRLLGHTAD
jgi:8-oxo-dGTP pyrophosphatase MutT (NUDIX family)